MDIGNQQDVQKRAKAAKVARAKERDALKWLMGDERGRTYVAMLVRESHAVTSEVALQDGLVLFREGLRSMGLKILRDVREHTPEQFAPLLAMALATPTEGAKSDDRDE